MATLDLADCNGLLKTHYTSGPIQLSLSFQDSFKESVLALAVARLDLSDAESAAFRLGGPAAVLELRGLDPDTVYNGELLRRTRETKEANRVRVTAVTSGLGTIMMNVVK